MKKKADQGKPITVDLSPEAHMVLTTMASQLRCRSNQIALILLQTHLEGGETGGLKRRQFQLLAAAAAAMSMRLDTVWPTLLRLTAETSEPHEHDGDGVVMARVREILKQSHRTKSLVLGIAAGEFKDSCPELAPALREASSAARPHSKRAQSGEVDQDAEALADYLEMLGILPAPNS